jgi:hypothetical protein
MMRMKHWPCSLICILYRLPIIGGRVEWVLIYNGVLRSWRPVKVECYRLAVTKCMWNWEKFLVALGGEEP